MLFSLNFALGYILPADTLFSFWFAICEIEYLHYFRGTSRLYFLPFIAGQLMRKTIIPKKEVNESVSLSIVLLGIYMEAPIILLPFDWPYAVILFNVMIEYFLTSNSLIPAILPLFFGIFLVTYAEKFKYLFLW